MVDDPADTRRHGTAMASLILHGDLAANERSLPKPLYVRPILQLDPRDWMNPQVRRETVPEGTFVVDAPSATTGPIFRAPMDCVP